VLKKKGKLDSGTKKWKETHFPGTRAKHDKDREKTYGLISEVGSPEERELPIGKQRFTTQARLQTWGQRRRGRKTSEQEGQRPEDHHTGIFDEYTKSYWERKRDKPQSKNRLRSDRRGKERKQNKKRKRDSAQLGNWPWTSNLTQ